MSKIKMKTKRAALKRFQLTGKGKIKYKKRGLRHILTKHSSESKRSKRACGYIKTCDYHLVLKCLPNGTM